MAALLNRRLRKRIGRFFGLSLVDESVSKVPVVVYRDGRPPAERPAGTDAYLGVAAIIKDEGPYLREWIEFHRLVGVDRFFLYDNASSDDTHKILEPYVRQGLVDLVPWPNFLAGANHQHLAYGHAARHAADKVRWLAVIDADEFLFAPSGESLPEVLREYEDLPALGVFLRCFGPSGHEAKPDGLVTESYTLRLPDTAWENQQYKSIIDPRAARSVISAQRFHNVHDNVPAYDERRRPLTTSIKHFHVSERLRINHYATKSIEEMTEKINRRYFWSEKNDDRRRSQKTQQHGALLECDVRDEEILRFLPNLDAALRG